MYNKVIQPINESSPSTIRKYDHYTLEDMTRESEKELFSVVTTFSGGGGPIWMHDSTVPIHGVQKHLMWWKTTEVNDRKLGGICRQGIIGCSSNYIVFLTNNEIRSKFQICFIKIIILSWKNDYFC